MKDLLDTAGIVAFFIGNETGGSIVSPAMRCGNTGLRPTFGRVARTGAMTLCWSLDKLGPMTRTVEDAMLVLQAIDGPDAGDPSSVPSRLDFDAPRRVPHGITLVGRLFDDATIGRVGVALERAFGVVGERPPGF